MRKTRAKAAVSNSRSAAAAPSNPATIARRKQEKRLKRRKQLRDWGLSLLAVLLIVGAVTQYTRVAIAREDLSIVGQGQPVIVQVHDRQCIPCGVLQRNTKKALRSFDKSDVGYVVAYLNKINSASFARRYSAGQTTLLLFDGSGELKGRVQGESDVEELEEAFITAFEIAKK